jgi:HEAT repeat protein
MRKAWICGLVTLGVLAVACWLEPTGVVRGWVWGESFFQGRPTNYWHRKLLSDDPVVQSTAHEELSQGGPDAVSVLLELLGSQGEEEWQSAETRWQAAEILGHIGPDAQASSTALLAALKDPDLHVRLVAATSLAQVETPANQAVPALQALLKADVSESALRALSVYGAEAVPALEDLLGILSNESLDTELRWNAARTLGKMREAGAAAIPTIVKYLQDPAPTVREHCAEALGDIGPLAMDSVPALVAVLNDPATRVRRDSVRSLGQIRAPADEVLPAIEPLLNDPESIVREAARTAWKAIAPEVPLPKKQHRDEVRGDKVRDHTERGHSERGRQGGRETGSGD